MCTLCDKTGFCEHGVLWSPLPVAVSQCSGPVLQQSEASSGTGTSAHLPYSTAVQTRDVVFAFISAITELHGVKHVNARHNSQAGVCASVVMQTCSKQRSVSFKMQTCSKQAALPMTRCIPWPGRSLSVTTHPHPGQDYDSVAGP